NERWSVHHAARCAAQPVRTRGPQNLPIAIPSCASNTVHCASASQRPETSATASEAGLIDFLVSTTSLHGEPLLSSQICAHSNLNLKAKRYNQSEAQNISMSRVA